MLYLHYVCVVDPHVVGMHACNGHYDILHSAVKLMYHSQVNSIPHFAARSNLYN